MDFFERTAKWLRYARSNFWQAVGILILGAIPILIGHIFLRQIEVWEDDFLSVHGTHWAKSALVVVIDFLARNPVWSIALFALAVVLALIIHAYIATHPFFQFEKESGPKDSQRAQESAPNAQIPATAAQHPEELVVAVENCWVEDCAFDPYLDLIQEGDILTLGNGHRCVLVSFHSKNFELGNVRAEITFFDSSLRSYRVIDQTFWKDSPANVSMGIGQTAKLIMALVDEQGHPFYPQRYKEGGIYIRGKIASANLRSGLGYGSVRLRYEGGGVKASQSFFFSLTLDGTPEIKQINALHSPLLENRRETLKQGLPPSPLPAEEPEPTLLSLMDTSFPRFNKKWQDGTVQINNGIFRPKTIVQVKTALYFELTSNATFLGFYVPSSPRTVAVCGVLAGRAREIARQMAETGLLVIVRSPGENPQEVRNYGFTGKVYIHHDDALTHQEMGNIEGIFHAHRLEVVLRGPDFLTTAWIAWKTKQTEEEKLPKTEPAIDGEVYRLVMSPRVMEWDLVRQVFQASGRKDDPLIDTDILVEMYLVNKSTERVRYIREMRLSAEVDGKRIPFIRQRDLFAEEFNGKKFDYGIRDASETFRENPKPLKQLGSELPLALAPEQPAEGWVRFMAKNINPDKIASGTIMLTVVDSVGKEYSIHKVPVERERRGEISLRRLAG